MSMNRTVLKKAHRLHVYQDRIRFEVGNLDVEWHVPGVNGGGRAVLPDDIKRAGVTAAFKKGEIRTANDNLEFSRGKITVRVPLLDDVEDHPPLPTNAPNAMPWEPGIMGVREAASGYPSRGVFTGVQFEPERIVASDGFRLYAMDTYMRVVPHVKGVFSPLPVEQAYNGKYLLGCEQCCFLVY